MCWDRDLCPQRLNQITNSQLFDEHLGVITTASIGNCLKRGSAAGEDRSYETLGVGSEKNKTFKTVWQAVRIESLRKSECDISTQDSYNDHKMGSERQKNYNL